MFTKTPVAFTPLMQQLINGHNDIVEFLLSQGADIDVVLMMVILPSWLPSGTAGRNPTLIQKGVDANANNLLPQQALGESNLGRRRKPTSTGN